MKEFAKDFYNCRAWKETRKAYATYKRNLCERCLTSGQYKAGEIVHHKIVLTPVNIKDANVTLNWNNLQLVCRECHAELHGAKQRRYKLDELGRVIFNIPPIERKL